MGAWAGAVERYLAMLGAAGRSPRTLELRRYTLWAFDRWHTATYHEPAPFPCPQEPLLEYLTYQHRHLARNSVVLFHADLDHFLRWCVTAELCERNPLAGIPRPRREVKASHPLTDADIATLLGHADMWDRAILLLGIGSGVRVGEMHKLRWCDFHDGDALIHGKGAKERRVAVARAAMRELSLLPRDGEYVFPFNDKWALCRMARLSRRSGIHIHCHLLRYTFATRFLKGGGGFDNLRVLLGHSDFRMTAYYVRAVEGERALDAQKEYQAGDTLLDGEPKGKVIPFRRRS